MEIGLVILVALAVVAGLWVLWRWKKPARGASAAPLPLHEPLPGTSAPAVPRHEPTPAAHTERDAAREVAPAATETKEDLAVLPQDGLPQDGGAHATDAASGDASDSPATLVESSSPPPVHGAGEPDANSSLRDLRKGLFKSREKTGFFGRLKALLGAQKEIDASLAQQLEELLLSSDVGVQTTERILERLKEGLSRGDLKSETKVLAALREEAARALAVGGRAGSIQTTEKPTVVLFVGVNGAGKTTTIGKLAQKFTAQGHKVMLAAGDTFRAAAVAQLEAWGQRTGCEVISGKEGADPSSVLFDAIQAAKARGVDVLLADTAGRLHTKTNLMQEMTKVQKVAAKALEGAPHETLLVIDATTGQNALAQAREFKEALPITGLVLTKLDGTAKGGVVLGICDSLRIPVRYVGVGERVGDLHEFDPNAFVEALLGQETEDIAA